VTIESKITKTLVVGVVMETISLQCEGDDAVKRASGWKLSAACQINCLTICLKPANIAQKALVK
jgi:hypothetical protein